MWRFMLIVFGFLGFAFYELSGGSDYSPDPGSLQVAMAGKSIFAEPKPVAVSEMQLASNGNNVGLLANLKERRKVALDRVADARKARKEESYMRAVTRQDSGLFPVTLASIDAADSPIVFESAEIRDLGIDNVGAFSAATLIRDANVAREGSYETASLGGVTPDFGANVRSVTGSLVNMRDGPGTDFARLDQVSEGTRVEVIESTNDGWLRLRVIETGQTGWMADWLVSGG